MKVEGASILHIYEFADELIVAEKPSVAEAFARALSEGKYRTKRMGRIKFYTFEREGRRWISIGLKGHIFNYDFEAQYNSWREVDPKTLFYINPIRVIERTSISYVDALKKLARHVETVYLALDADTEGESICFEVMDIVKSVNPYVEFKRLWFNSTVKEELLDAFKKPRKPQRTLAEKCFARMIVDLTIGAAFTRLITMSIQRRNPRALPYGRFLSYGPCQSPTLYLVVERAWEREKFKPEKFYMLKAKVNIYGAIYEAIHKARRINEREKVEEIYRKIKDARRAKVEKFRVKKRKKKPPKPLTTLELESRVSRYLNIRSKNTLDIAENLYRNGYISYPRTETEIYPEKLKLKSRIQAFIKNSIYGEYASKILEKKIIKPTRGRRDDRAHPPIHPTRSAEKDEITRKFGGKAWKIYDFIVRHFLATVSDDAEVENRRLDLNINGEIFILRGTTVSKEGYLAIYPFEKPGENYIPILERGEEVEILEINIIEGETEPPPYLSEAELLKKMDEYGIGTDATKQDHIQTNIDRGYFYIERKRCIPTPLGKALIEALNDIVPEVVKPEVRGFMEEMFNQIAVGKRRMEEVVEKAKKYFLEKYEKLHALEERFVEKLIPTIGGSIKVNKTGKKRKWRKF